MCGFIGYFNNDKSHPGEPRFELALDLLKHRGPDASGKSTFNLESGYLEFGFRRLAIIDLSDSANQPFFSNDKRFAILFNGEIYNYLELKSKLASKGYSFRTESDTEVLLAAWQEWGLNSINMLIGMFSIVIYDKLKSELWCIRDPYGIKPLFYSNTGTEFIFGSEIAAVNKLRKQPPRIDNQTAMRYLADGEYDRSKNSFFLGVNQLEPGHFIRLDLSHSKILINSSRWWFPTVQQNTDISFQEAAEALKEAFLESVSLHLRSDVRVATALSGGLDSSAIVSAIRKIDSTVDIHTFSYVADDPSINEQKWVNLVNSNTGSIPHHIEINSSDFLLDLDDLIRTQGEPFGSTSLYAQFRVYKAAREAGVTVMLDGQGADELLAGYHGYPENRIQTFLEKRQYGEMLNFIKRWSEWPGRDAKSLLRSTAKSILTAKNQEFITSVLKNNRHASVLNSKYHRQESFLDVYDESQWEGRRLSQRLLKEQSNGALTALLRHADRNSMRWSIESRVPFLNPKLTELISSFPESFLLDENGRTKSVFREAMRGIVDNDILDRKDKIGFATPQSKWVTNEWLENQKILEIAREFSFIDVASLTNLFAGEHNANARITDLKWRLINLVKWAKIMEIQL